MSQQNQDQKWALHNTLKGWIFFDLTVPEVQILVQSMSVNELRLSKVAEKNSSAWITISQEHCPQFFEKRNNDSRNYPALPVERGTTTQTSNNIDTDYFVIKKRVEIPRLHKRYDIIVMCTIFSTKKNFETESINISEGGLQFKELLPDWIAGYFIVGVKSPQGQIQLMCSLVEDQKEKRRVQIVAEDSDPQFIIYKRWLSTLP